jgi:hypothetical protein
MNRAYVTLEVRTPDGRFDRAKLVSLAAPNLARKVPAEARQTDECPLFVRVTWLSYRLES